MNARELLTDWPGEQLTSAEGIFQSPAWRLPIVYEGAPSVLTQGTTRPLDLLALSLTFDGEPSVIGLADSPNFPDLHILWRRRHELPREVLLALIEKECGPLFQMLEDATKCLVAVKGLEWDEVGETDVPFALTRPDGLTLAFTWAVPPRVLARLGVLDNLDLTHAAIRALTRPAWAVYASLTLTSSDCAGLAVGDCLVMDEGAEPTWTPALPNDGVLRICASAEGSITFAQFVDETLPSVPPAKTVTVFQGTVPIARGVVEQLGEQKVVRVGEIVGSI